MNKSVMKCCICNNENIGQFITINNKKYHLCCIEQLQQENKILKENAENNDKVVDKVNWENMLLKKENQQLQERIEYLERSNNRREDTILEQRQEISNLEDTYCDRTDCSSRIKDSKKYDSLKQKYDKQVDNWNKLKADLELVVGYCFGDEASRWDKTYGEHAKATLNYMRELEQGSDSDEKISKITG